MLRRLASSFDATLLWISKAGRLIVDVLVRCRPLLAIISNHWLILEIFLHVLTWAPRTHSPECIHFLAFLHFWPILKLLGAFAYFSWFQPGRPEHLQTARFYEHSFNFDWYWSQRVLLLTFRGFSVAAQNPSRRHDFTRIHAVLSDFEANDLF